MKQHSNSDQPQNIEGLLWIILIILSVALTSVLVQRNWQIISEAIGIQAPVNFDEVMITTGTHDIMLDDGRAYDISYETSRKRDFAGLVRHSSAINEYSFGILTYDILITSGDFSNADLVQTSVTNHHFTWMSSTLSDPKGKINLLHTVPINEAVNQSLNAVKSGDTIIISGYDIYRIEGYEPQGTYIGYWQDSGCNTTLVTDVKIIETN